MRKDDTAPIPKSPILSRVVRKGFYQRSSDRRRIARFLCLKCRKNFSRATGSACFGQKKRQINFKIARLLYSGVSQRRAARLLKVSRLTVERKFRFIAQQCRLEQMSRLAQLSSAPEPLKMGEIYFDEMESFEKSKCLPVSIPIVVEAKTRKILGFRVCSMPAKGPLAEISRRKYGLRADERAQAASSLFAELRPLIQERAKISSDQNPKYPAWLKPHFPNVNHVAYKGRRGCVVGQGELKRGGFDPLFDLNHTCAMLRANINRLFRRTWCTTKRRDRLEDHIAIYVSYHNSVLT